MLEHETEQEFRAYFKSVRIPVSDPQTSWNAVRQRIEGSHRRAGAALRLGFAAAAVAVALAPLYRVLLPAPRFLTLTERSLPVESWQAIVGAFNSPAAMESKGVLLDVHTSDDVEVTQGDGTLVFRVRPTYARFVYLVDGRPLSITERAAESATPGKVEVIVVRPPVVPGSDGMNRVLVTAQNTEFILEGPHSVERLIEVARALIGQ